MADKLIIGDINVSFSKVKKGELAITEGELILYKKRSLFSSKSVVSRFRVSAIDSAKAEPDHRLRVEGSTDADHIFTETVTFQYKSELDKVLKHLQERLEEKAAKLKEEKEREVQKKEQERKERVELNSKFVRANVSFIWAIHQNLFRLCSAIPQAEWTAIKQIGGALQQAVDNFLKLNGMDKESKLPNFKELAEKEELFDLEKGMVSLLDFLGTTMAAAAPPAAPPPPEGGNILQWSDLKFYSLYTGLVAEAGLLIDLDEPSELFGTAAKIERLQPIVSRLFGFAKDRSLATSLTLPKKHEAALAIHKKLVGEIDAYVKSGEGPK